MITAIIVFRTPRPQRLTSFIHELTDPHGGGAIDIPTVKRDGDFSEVQTRFGDLVELGGVSDFSQRWADDRPDIEYIGTRKVL